MNLQIQILTIKMGIVKITLKKKKKKTGKNWKFPFFAQKTIKNFGNSHVFFTFATKKVLNFFVIPMKNVGEILGILCLF